MLRDDGNFMIKSRVPPEKGVVWNRALSSVMSVAD